MFTRPFTAGSLAAVSRHLAVPLLALTTGLSLPASAQVIQHFALTNLTSNRASLAPNVDPNLVNAWGLSRSSRSPWWVSDNGTGLSTLYDGTGKAQSLVVTVPPSSTDTSTGNPTGTVFNGDPNAFQIAPGKAAAFLFATEDGTISGWNPGVLPTAAKIVVNNKGKSVYKGLTVASVEIPGATQTYLYAADFHRGRIDVFDKAFNPVHFGEESFDDDRLPDGYAPFNVQNIGGNIYVAYAKQDGARHDEVAGAGRGYVDIFSPRGRLLMRLEHGPWFNAPWGLVLAASDFGAFTHDILVGQFGSGEIVVFDPVTGKYKGKLNGANNLPLVVDGLWALSFGNDAGAGPATTLYFTAGPDDESNGLFGSITAVENPQGNDQ